MQETWVPSLGLEDPLASMLGIGNITIYSSVQLLNCVRLSDPKDRSTPGFPVHHQLPELAQTRVSQVGDTIQPSHPLIFRSR